MKNIIMTTLVAGLASTAAYAGENVNAKVRDKYETIYSNEEQINRKCRTKDVPVYGTVTRRGNAGEGAILGMILGGVTGKVISGDDKGAAAGAILGGVIGADKGAKPKTETVITGYRKERECFDEVTYVRNPKKVYAYSVIKFNYEGRTYRIEFVK